MTFVHRDGPAARIGSPVPTGSSATAAGADVDRPAGWSSMNMHDTGLRVAAARADATGQRSGAPRMIVRPSLPAYSTRLKGEPL